ncbi:MAG: AbrB family transcriptional regulator [Nodosilinea sp.]
MANVTQTEPLVGEELLQKVKNLDELSKEDKAKACGYYTLTKSGNPRVNMMKFLNALIEAEGIQLDSGQGGNGRGGRSASFRITVQSNGNLLIGSTYTKQMGLRPGDEFEISLGRKHIRLKHLGEDDLFEDE